MAQAGPNPQTNLIISIVAPVVSLIVIAVLYFTRPTPSANPTPSAVNTTVAKNPPDGVVYANALPGAGTSAGAASGGASMGPSFAAAGGAGGGPARRKGPGGGMAGN